MTLPFLYHETEEYIQLQEKLGLTYSERKTYAAALYIIDTNVNILVEAFKAKTYGEDGSETSAVGITAGSSYYDNTYFIVTMVRRVVVPPVS